MRILILTQFFDPEPGPRGIDFAKKLSEEGHEVQVLTGFPNYPDGILYPGYRLHAIQREIIKNIPVTRVALYPSHNQSKCARIANYLSFAASATLYGIFMRFRPDVMYVYHPPLTVSMAAAIIGFFRGIPFVPDIQDLWPDTLKATGMINNDKVLSIIGKIAEWIYRRASCICVQSPGFMRCLVARGVPPEKIRFVPNWCNETLLCPPQKCVELSSEKQALSGKFIILCAGNMGKAQAMDYVLDAAILVQKVRSDIVFVFVGGGLEVPTLKARVESQHIGNVTFLPARPMDAMPLLFAASDVLLVHLKDDPLFAITIPSRVQAYLYAEKPVIIGVTGDAADIIREAKAGIVVPPENAQAIADAALQLAAMPLSERAAMGASGKAYYMENFSRSAGVKRMLEAFTYAVNNKV